MVARAKGARPIDDEPQGDRLYYILDIRAAAGDCALWWRPEGQGYTCDLDDAGTYTKKEAGTCRDTDVLVPVELARSLGKLHVGWDALCSAGVRMRPKR